MSGKIEISVNSIKNLNNINNKNAKGSYEDVASDSLYDNYKNYYNRQPNNVNNDLLEDDVELAIWGINSQSAVSPEGFVSEATMHINPSDGQLGFSFSSGNYGYYPYGVDYNGNYYSVIFGRYINGGFFSIPNWNVGGELGEFSDTFWNTESLSRVLKSKKAAKVIAMAIAEFAEE